MTRLHACAVFLKVDCDHNGLRELASIMMETRLFLEIEIISSFRCRINRLSCLVPASDFKPGAATMTNEHVSRSVVHVTVAVKQNWTKICVMEQLKHWH